MRERLPSLRVEGEKGERTLKHFFGEVLEEYGVPEPQDLETLLGEFLIPSWKALGRAELVELMIDKKLFRRDELLACLDDTRREVVTRGYDAIRVKEQWKGGGYPDTTKGLASLLQTILGPLYRATGADRLLEEVHELAFLEAAPESKHLVPERPFSA